MARLPIVIVNETTLWSKDNTLRQKCRAINVHDPEELTMAQRLINEMLRTLYSDPSGVAIAAPQVGALLQITVISYDDKDTGENHLMALLNPTITSLSDEMNEDAEICLSVPNFSGKVRRASSIQVDAYDQHGKPVTFIAGKWFARVIQHEVDHLSGILYIDKALGELEEVADFPERRTGPALRKLGLKATGSR
jgi:peptide deformylase